MRQSKACVTRNTSALRPTTSARLQLLGSTHKCRHQPWPTRSAGRSGLQALLCRQSLTMFQESGLPAGVSAAGWVSRAQRLFGFCELRRGRQRRPRPPPAVTQRLVNKSRELTHRLDDPRYPCAHGATRRPSEFFVQCRRIGALLGDTVVYGEAQTSQRWRLARNLPRCHGGPSRSSER